MNENLNVSNDLNQRRIVPRVSFLEEIVCLVLKREDICLLACALVEKSCRSKSDEMCPINPSDPEATESRDLQRMLRDIGSWSRIDGNYLE